MDDADKCTVQIAENVVDTVSEGGSGMSDAKSEMKWGAYVAREKPGLRLQAKSRVPDTLSPVS